MCRWLKSNECDYFEYYSIDIVMTIDRGRAFLKTLEKHCLITGFNRFYNFQMFFFYDTWYVQESYLYFKFTAWNVFLM